MAAFSANTNTTVILIDTASRAVVKDVLYLVTAGDVSARLVVNAATLAGRTMTLTGVPTFNPAPAAGPIPGETITSAGGTKGYVVGTLNAAHTTFQAVLANSQVAFANGDVLTTETSNVTFTVGGSGAVLNPAKVSIVGAWWSISGNSTGSVISVEFANSDCAFTASGTGWFGKGNIPEAITPGNAYATGDILVSTYGLSAKSGYTLVLDIRKELGFAQRPIY
jgi:hypothetical protein